ncbi:MAG TPA: alpha/beta hydrolase [Actinomycetota bacterium]|jgi:pimeloyl-ACP methyl ester carboxylesterase|nr:alpha/beta hydrolase [Actinomycetota bacterium]
MNVFERYRQDIDAERRRVASLAWRSANTSFGPIEYLDRGDGAPVFVVHGITQAADGGLRDLAEEVVPNGYRLIIPSRFGYLGSAMPEHPSVEAQADAFAELMDTLGVEAAVVVAASAGSTSALHLAIRHPERVRGLVLVSANVPGSHQSKGMPPKPVFRGIFGSDPILWASITYAPGLIARLSQVLVVPEGVDLVPGDEDNVMRAMRNVLLGRRRVAGEVFDAYVSNPQVNRIDMTRVGVPTLILHARDDPGPPYASAVAMSHRIPDAQLITVERGGHMLLGAHADELREVARFIEDHSAVPSDLAR